MPIRQAAIVSRTSPLIKRVKTLHRSTAARRREGVFLVEGIQPVSRALEAAWEIETLLYSSELLRSAHARRLVQSERERGTNTVDISGHLFHEVSDRDAPAGIAALVTRRVSELSDLQPGNTGTILALHEPRNPGNVGTIIRTANAAGKLPVVLLGDSTDPFSPAAVKASMGSLFAVDIVQLPDASGFLHWARSRDLAIVATSARAGAVDHWSVDYSLPMAAMFGSEGCGLPAEVIDGADLVVRIPMAGTADSLNLAVACGVFMYEVKRRRCSGFGGSQSAAST